MKLLAPFHVLSNRTAEQVTDSLHQGRSWEENTRGTAGGG
jgi:hypothetical protein